MMVLLLFNRWVTIIQNDEIEEKEDILHVEEIGEILVVLIIIIIMN